MFYPRPEPGTNAEILRLQPALLAVSADHFKTVLWPQLAPSLAELQVIFTAAVRLVSPHFQLPSP